MNMVKAMFGDHKVPFYKSGNDVILTEGLEDGSLPPQYFRTIQDFKKKEFMQ